MKILLVLFLCISSLGYAEELVSLDKPGLYDRIEIEREQRAFSRRCCRPLHYPYRTAPPVSTYYHHHQEPSKAKNTQIEK